MRPKKRLLIFPLLLVLFIATLALAAVFRQLRAAADAAYPGSLQLSANDTGRFLPNPVFKTTTSYITEDSYPEVLRWYTLQFDLGLVRVGLEKCTHSFRENRQYGLSFDVAVTVCDTENGRLIFVERTTIVRCEWRFCP